MKKLLPFLLIFFACSKSQESPTAEFGFSFVAPPGWSELSQEELNQLFPETKSVYTVGNQDRTGIITVVTHEIPESQANAYKAAMGYFLDQIEKSAQNRYYDYRLHEKGQINWKGKDAWELIYEGTLPTEAQKWRRLITFPSPIDENVLIFLGFSCPAGMEEDYIPRFKYVEESWEWN